MGRGAGLYAVTLAARARGGESERDAAVADLVRRYQIARQRAAGQAVASSRRPAIRMNNALPAVTRPHCFSWRSKKRAGIEPLRRACIVLSRYGGQ